MVVVHLKVRDADQFLYEAPTGTSNDILTREVVDVWNMRHRSIRLVEHCQDLCNHGPYKHPDNHGIDDALMEQSGGATGERPAPTHIEEGRVYQPDPCGRRSGLAPTEELAQIITKETYELKSLCDKRQVDAKVTLKKEVIQEAIDRVRGAIMIVWPMGLPEYDPVREALEDREDLAGHQASQDVHDPNTAQLWWASKTLDRNKTLGDFVGKNEKTKIVAKLTKKGSQAPAKEPPLDAEGQKNLMAYWHKKQEEAKKLAEDEDDSYLTASWANPKGIKQSFTGVGDVSWRPR
eukprot:GFYU01003667.1.p1 GENE.GFYU01003667.1~~GFYU01003667.1.p1  ORF type:complete len:292 (-),score=109.81 GFYU01003667.1:244-1119(-)